MVFFNFVMRSFQTQQIAGLLLTDTGFSKKMKYLLFRYNRRLFLKSRALNFPKNAINLKLKLTKSRFKSTINTGALTGFYYAM
jgi:hypothetical protein